MTAQDEPVQDIRCGEQLTSEKWKSHSITRLNRLNHLEVCAARWHPIRHSRGGVAGTRP